MSKYPELLFISLALDFVKINFLHTTKWQITATANYSVTLTKPTQM